MYPKINYISHISSLLIVISAFVLLSPTADNLGGAQSVFGYGGAGISVDNTAVLNGYAVADDSYTNGFRFKMRVTVGSGTESNLGLRFDNWSKVGGGGSIASTSNMQVNNANTIVGAVPAATTYGSPLALGADLDPGMPGVQQDVYVWLKVPAATVGGAYSTSYGVMSSM